jgi:hypothetical protein
MKPFAVQVAQRTRIGSRARNEDCIAVEHLRGHWCLVLSDPRQDNYSAIACRIDEHAHPRL